MTLGLLLLRNLSLSTGAGSTTGSTTGAGIRVPEGSNSGLHFRKRCCSVYPCLRAHSPPSSRDLMNHTCPFDLFFHDTCYHLSSDTTLWLVVCSRHIKAMVPALMCITLHKLRGYQTMTFRFSKFWPHSVVKVGHGWDELGKPSSQILET